MKIALVHDHYDKNHLAEVVEQMKTLGAPKIRAIWMECYDMYAALEGCHRLRAAAALGLTPEIIEVNYDEVCEIALNDPALGLDFDNDNPVAWLVDDCHRRKIITFMETA